MPYLNILHVSWSCLITQMGKLMCMNVWTGYHKWPSKWRGLGRLLGMIPDTMSLRCDIHTKSYYIGLALDILPECVSRQFRIMFLILHESEFSHESDSPIALHELGFRSQTLFIPIFFFYFHHCYQMWQSQNGFLKYSVICKLSCGKPTL